jgi:hypothetical protein
VDWRLENAEVNVRSPTRWAAVATASALLAVTQIVSFSHADDAPSFKPAVPVDPIDGILNAFKIHDLVVLGEGAHNNEQAHAFRLQLVRDPRFSRVVDDIVVESGNALHQDVIDRFMRGEDVPHSDLRRVWQDTTVANTVWDVPIYEAFFRAVRELNATLPKERQLRVLLGDPPIDWNRIGNRDDWLKWLNQRDTYPSGLIEREVVAKGRKALVVYGDGHLMRKNVFWGLSNMALAEERSKRPLNSLVVLLERAGARVFSVYTSTRADLTAVQPDVAGWQAPKLAIVAGTVLDHFHPWETYIMVDPSKGTFEKAVADPERSPSMGEQFDAILYLGPPSSITMSKLPVALCADADYMKMRAQRAGMTAVPAAAAQAAAIFEQDCKKLLE